MKWWAFELVTDGSYHLGAYLYESERDDQFALVKEALGDYVDSYALGTIEGPNDLGDALDSIRAGDWEFTQKT